MGKLVISRCNHKNLNSRKTRIILDFVPEDKIGIESLLLWIGSANR